MFAIRGAITVSSDLEEEILQGAIELFETILTENKISTDDIVSVIFSCTPDLSRAYPAKALRMKGYDLPYMCFAELNVENSLPECIRIMVTVDLPKRRDVKHIYLRDAVTLRPDLVNE